MNASASLRPLFTFSLALSSLCLALPGHAESFASSASSAGSASSGSASDSIKGSSNSSTSDKKVAEGPYRVMQVAEVANDKSAGTPARRPMLQLTLRATDAGPVREFILELPRQALADQPIQTGDVVQARLRPYGYEFARGETQQAFFLVLNDDWQREIDSRAVTL